MTVLVPTTLDEAYALLAASPAAHVLAGGTDFMVEVNFGHRHPDDVLVLRRLTELRGWRREGDHLVLGAGLTYAEMESPALAALVPALAQAARTVGSPQIRAAGTLGGNLGTASPAGDTLPVLAALDAEVMLGSAQGTRTLPLLDFVVGPKRNARRPGELIVSVRVPVLDGPQAYLKIGTRNAMVIAVADVALVVDRNGRTVRCALGSVGPTVLRAHDAEAHAAAAIDWERFAVDDVASVASEFGRLAAAAARPIDDHRSTAAYRRRGIEVLAGRALRRVLGPGTGTATGGQA